MNYLDRVQCTSCNGSGSTGEHGCTDCLGRGLDHAAFVGGVEEALNDAYAEGRKDEREDLQAVIAALLAAAQCAANVLFLLQDEVKALGCNAKNVQEQLRAAIALATKETT